MTEPSNLPNLKPQPLEMKPKSGWRSRRIWEPVTTAMILGGIVMLMQPFALFLYTYSFIVILIGTIGFAVATKQPD
jgi:hypothetical protein